MNFQGLVLELLEEAFKAEKEQGLHGWFREIKARAGLIVRQESLAVGKKEKSEKVIQHVVRQWRSALIR
jgi:hypothetical protein